MFKKAAVYIGVAVVANTPMCTNAQQTIPLPPGQTGSVMNQVMEFLEDKTSDLNPFSGTAAMLSKLRESFDVLV